MIYTARFLNSRQLISLNSKSITFMETKVFCNKHTHAIIQHFIPLGAYQVMGKTPHSPMYKRIINSRLTIQLSQCSNCVRAQKMLMSDYFIRKDSDGMYYLSYCQCLVCLSGMCSFFLKSKSVLTTCNRKR